MSTFFKLEKYAINALLEIHYLTSCPRTSPLGFCAVSRLM